VAIPERGADPKTRLNLERGVRRPQKKSLVGKTKKKKKRRKSLLECSETTALGQNPPKTMAWNKTHGNVRTLVSGGVGGPKGRKEIGKKGLASPCRLSPHESVKGEEPIGKKGLVLLSRRGKSFNKQTHAPHWQSGNTGETLEAKPGIVLKGEAVLSAFRKHKIYEAGLGIFVKRMRKVWPGF